MARTDSTVSRGVRQSSAIAYLGRRPKNLTVLTRRHVARLVLDGRRAVGVETTGGEVISAGREVIVCQGAFGTPQLLMLSGIGPAEHLRAHGIEPVLDAPGVGANLADHLDVSMQYASDRIDLSTARYQRLDRAALLMGRWLLNGSGPGGGALFSAVLFHAFEDVTLPELQVFMTPMIIDENLGSGDRDNAPLLQRLGRRLLVRGRKVARPGLQIDINLERPRSLGTVRLRSADPLDHPLIDPNFLSHPGDIDALVRGVAAMREVMARPEIARYHQGEIGVWKDAVDREQIIEAIRETAYTGHHPCSTARMGTDLDAVLDDQLRVRGIEGLRVCDAAAMPTQITGNLYATVVAMAEKAADMILQRPPPPPERWGRHHGDRETDPDLLEGDEGGPHRYAPRESRGAVDRVDDPPPACVVGTGSAELLPEHGVVRTLGGQGVHRDLLGGPVGLGHLGVIRLVVAAETVGAERRQRDRIAAVRHLDGETEFGGEFDPAGAGHVGLPPVSPSKSGERFSPSAAWPSAESGPRKLSIS